MPIILSESFFLHGKTVNFLNEEIPAQIFYYGKVCEFMGKRTTKHNFLWRWLCEIFNSYRDTYLSQPTTTPRTNWVFFRYLLYFFTFISFNKQKTSSTFLYLDNKKQKKEEKNLLNGKLFLFMLLVRSAKHKFSHIHKYFLEKLKKIPDYQKFKLKYELNWITWTFFHCSLCLTVSKNTENKKKTGKYQQQHHQLSYRKNKIKKNVSEKKICKSMHQFSFHFSDR